MERNCSSPVDPPSSLRVLVVDDDALCLLVVSRMLQRCKHQGAGV
jgi:CheY-like chemotaxis protein